MFVCVFQGLTRLKLLPPASAIVVYLICATSDDIRPDNPLRMGCYGELWPTGTDVAHDFTSVPLPIDRVLHTHARSPSCTSDPV